MDRESDIRRLKELLDEMIIPITRRENMDLPWMTRNLGIHNSESPYFKEAMSIIIRLLRDKGYTVT